MTRAILDPNWGLKMQQIAATYEIQIGHNCWILYLHTYSTVYALQ